MTREVRQGDGAALIHARFASVLLRKARGGPPSATGTLRWLEDRAEPAARSGRPSRARGTTPRTSCSSGSAGSPRARFAIRSVRRCPSDTSKEQVPLKERARHASPVAVRFFEGWRVALAVASMVAGWSAAGCQDPCVTLAERICNCEPSSAERQSCRRTRIVNQQSNVAIEEADRELCQAKLETCTCVALDENNLEACGFTPIASDEPRE